MAPIPKAPPSVPEPKLFSRTHPATPEDDIVIAGVSGRFPNSKNVEEFAHNLYNKIDMVDDEEIRWRHFNVEIPKRMGKVHDLEKFDATFFGVHFKQAHTMDPQCRLLIEAAYEAVLDAGINPKTLRGTRTGVFIGACFSESEKTWFYEKISSGGFGITGCSRAMLANRISYCLGLNGPSFLLDTACSSSMYALDSAFSAIRNGECDAALVGGSNLILHPYVTLQFARLGVLATNGFCRPFDVDATGYTRSEAICMLFLQKAKTAKRVYATLLYSKTNCDGYKTEGITYPSGSMQQKLLSEFYDEIGIDPSSLAYVEAHSTGTVVGDPEECAALDNVFCKNRTRPLPVGSVKSNIGHSESTSGACSITKVLLAFETGLVAPNINFTKIRPGIASLEEGRLSVCTDPVKLEGKLIGVNSFGFGGANAHALLRGNSKEKVNHGAPSDNLPRLVTWSGRTEEAISALMDRVQSQPLDTEFIALLHNIQNEETPGYIFRGFGLFRQGTAKGPAECLGKEVQHYSGLKRPVVWVFSGMGSQWCEMGASLMDIPLFRESVERCHQTLKPHGLDLISIITSSDPTTFDNILHSFVGIAAIQIAIVDILRVLEIPADYFIGHSVGELGCAYADGCFTAEQMILAAYSRGMSSLETKKIRGSMAAIGLGYNKIKHKVPAAIEVACHNGPDSCTISGPEADVAKFVAELKSQGIFAKEVPCSNIAYHSRYIADMGPNLLARLNKVIPEPKRRSSKWLSSSVPKSRWDNEDSQWSSAKYHTNNLLSSVLFEEASTLLPKNALTIEIAPHGLLQAILKKSMPGATHVPLTKRGVKDNTSFLLTALGKLFNHGLIVPVERIYPAVQFPVSRGTSMIAPIVRWEHSEDWFVTKFELQRSTRSGERKVKVSLTDQDYDFISGHSIDGRCLFPATAYLQLAWETLAMMKGPIFFDMDVEFEDVRFLRATAMNKGQAIEFNIMVQTGTGRFEISEGATAIVTGQIVEIENSRPLTELPPLPNTTFPILQERDFYKELRLRGYHYSGAFRSVQEARGDGLSGKVKWDLNWISFMDCLLQINILAKDSRNLVLPTRIEKMRINAKDHMALTANLDPANPYFDVQVSPELGILVAGGIEIFGMHTSPVGRRKAPGYPVLETYKFLPYLHAPELRKSDAVRVFTQIILENTPILKVKAVEVDLDNNAEPILPLFELSLGDLPLVTSDLMLLTAQDLSLGKIHVEDGKLSTQTNCLLIIVSNGFDRKEFVEGTIKCYNERGGYLVSRESMDFTPAIAAEKCPYGFQVISIIPTDSNEKLVLLQRSTNRKVVTALNTVINISNPSNTTATDDFEWLPKLKDAAKESKGVIVVAENNSRSGIVGLVNCIRKEPDGTKITCIFIDDKSAPPFNLEHPLYQEQLKYGLAINILRNGVWGSLRHLELHSEIEEKPRNDHCFANVLQRGDLSTLSWLQGPMEGSKIDKLVNVQYASINFRDIMMATGRLNIEVTGTNRLQQECILGFEFSGVNKKGERVMGTIISGAMASQIESNDYLTWRVPDHFSLREAATCPVVYMTVYVAFFTYKSIARGDSILIHAGSGGIGLAAIRVALAYGLEVYTTVSNVQKKQFIMETFPALKEQNIGNSRDCSFERMIKLRTNGKGVDYVLNSLAEDKLHASIRCLGHGGTFLEIGKFDLANDTKIGLGTFLKEITFRSVLVDSLFVAQEADKLKVYEMVERDLRSGIIQPLYSTVFRVNELEKAYRFLSTGKHVGKVVLKIREDAFDECTVPIAAIPRCYFDADSVYIIPGGLGGFGLELADWLIIRGARKLVLSSSRGITKSYQSYRIRVWEDYGVKTIVNTNEIATRAGCEKLFKAALALGPIGGIFNLAVQLRDAILENQTVDKFVECLQPKATATEYLDELSRKYAPQLRYFVVFSSVSCGRGNAGQSNYGMANSVMERIIEQRQIDGLPAKAVQWGAVGEVGLVADMAEDKIDMEIGGTLQQRISSCLVELDALLTAENEAIVSSMVVAEKRAGGDGKGNLIESVLNIMGIRDIKMVTTTATLSEVGMDSLMAVEIKQTLEREFEIFLTPQDLRALTFAKLQELADARVNKDGMENVKLKLASENRVTGVQLLLKNLGVEESSDKTVLRVSSKNNDEKVNTCVLLVPGIECVANSSWQAIASNLNLPAFILQLVTKPDFDTVSGITSSIIDQVKTEVFRKMEFFYLVGYSFGSLVTLEIAAALEEIGMKGHILLIDGSPLWLKQLCYAHVGGPQHVSDEVIQAMLLMAIVNIVLVDENPEEIISTFVDFPTWEEKVNHLVAYGAKSNLKYSAEYLRKMVYTMYSRLRLVFDFDINAVSKVKSSITLVRPTEVAVVDIEEDYDLSKCTEGTVQLKFIDGNHASMLDNPQLAQIINDVDPNLESDRSFHAYVVSGKNT